MGFWRVEGRSTWLRHTDKKSGPPLEERRSKHPSVLVASSILSAARTTSNVDTSLFPFFLEESW